MIQYQFCSHLRTISETKADIHKKAIYNACPTCAGKDMAQCDKCMLKAKVIDRYVQSNIPVDFWELDMKRNFKGHSRLMRAYNDISGSFDEYYKSGSSLLLVGNHGVGKTFFGTSVLKLAALRGLGALYVTLSDIVNVLIYGDSSTKFDARRELMMVSFLVIDEFDSRFVGTEAAAELFGRVLESIIRIRFQNQMPTILISNNSDPTKVLGESLGASISSLIAGYCIKIPVVGEDYRETKGAK